MDTCKICGEVIVDGFCSECGYANDGTEPIYCAPGETTRGVVSVEVLDSAAWHTTNHNNINVALAYIDGDPCIVDKQGTVLAILDKGVARRVLGEYVRSLNYIVSWKKLSDSKVDISIIGLSEDIDAEFGGGNQGLDFFM